MQMVGEMAQGNKIRKSLGGGGTKGESSVEARRHRTERNRIVTLGELGDAGGTGGWSQNEGIPQNVNDAFSNRSSPRIFGNPNSKTLCPWSAFSSAGDEECSSLRPAHPLLCFLPMVPDEMRGGGNEGLPGASQLRQMTTPQQKGEE
jgi:hypothetical protein